MIEWAIAEFCVMNGFTEPFFFTSTWLPVMVKEVLAASVALLKVMPLTLKPAEALLAVVLVAALEPKINWVASVLVGVEFVVPVAAFRKLPALVQSLVVPPPLQK